MNISTDTLNKIRKEDRLHIINEYGGYVIVDDNEVVDIIFDVAESEPGHVTFGVGNIMKLPKEKRNKTRGWFHRHGIMGLSQEDVMTTMKLTQFWGECYTLVLQPDGMILIIKTVNGKDFIFRKPTVIETERKEVKLYERRKGIFNRLIQEPK